MNEVTPPPMMKPVTVEELSELGLLDLSDYATERAAARAAIAMERMISRTSSPFTTAMINKRV